MLTIPDACGDISVQLSITLNEANSVNQQNLLKILLNVELLNVALPLKGHGSVQDSNFTQIYILREEDKERLKTWRTETKINKYVHSTIQNEMTQIAALRVLREVAENIKMSAFTR